MSPYQVLQVSPDASGDEIRTAYRERAREAHPDREGGSTSAMAAVNAAYHALRTPGLREKVDADLRRSAQPSVVEDMGVTPSSLGDSDSYAHMRATEVDRSRLRRAVLTLDGWVLPLDNRRIS